MGAIVQATRRAFASAAIVSLLLAPTGGAFASEEGPSPSPTPTQTSATEPPPPPPAPDPETSADRPGPRPTPEQSDPAPTAPAEPSPASPLLPVAEAVTVGALSIDRLAGRDRYETAISISQSGHPDGAPVVVLASGSDFPDALAAAPAATALGGPLLLTPPRELRDDVLGEIIRLDPQVVIIVGGASVVGEGVAARLRDAGIEVERQAGQDRYATARAIVARAFPASSEALLATGRAFPDALVAAAAAGAREIPVMLVDGTDSTIDAATLASLKALGVSSVGLAGGTGVISSGIARSLKDAGLSVARHAGADRYGTSLAIIRAYTDQAPRVLIASGADFPDALAGAVLAGADGAVLALSPGTCVDSSIGFDLRSRIGVERVTALGGEAVIAQRAAELTECPGASISERALTEKLVAQASTLPGQYAISVRELTGERHTISVQGAQRKEPASVIKVFAAYAVLARVDAGSLSLATRTRSGVPVSECLRTMIHISDNLCHADLLALVGNTAINRQLYAAGFRNTFYVGYDGTGRYQSAKKASTNDLALLLERLERGRLLSPASSALLSSLLDEQLWRSKLPSGIPTGVGFGNKTGQLWISTGLVEGDAGIVRAPTGTYSIAVLGDRNAANWAIARLSRTVYEHLGGRPIEPASWGEVNLVTTTSAATYNKPGSERLGTIAAGTRLAADVSNRVWYRVGSNGRWFWVHHSTVKTRY